MDDENFSKTEGNNEGRYLNIVPDDRQIDTIGRVLTKVGD